MQARNLKNGKPKNYIPDKSVQKIAGAFIQSADVDRFAKVIKVGTAKNDVTRNGIAEALKIKPNTVKEYIAKLKKEEKVKRIGPDRGGYWEVVE